MGEAAELHRIAASYPPEARNVPLWEREAHMTDIQQLAWLIRFDPDAAAEVLSAKEALPGKSFRGDRVRPRAHPHHGAHRG